MLNSTVSRLRCPRRQRNGSSCGGSLELRARESSSVHEVRSGNLSCRKCHSGFPILSGVAVLVDDVQGYLMAHVKGIAQIVPDSDIPEEFRDGFLDAKEEIEMEHIEEDLEAERVISLYLMNHYLRADSSSETAWWKPRAGSASPLIDSLVREYWDHGPFAQIERWMGEMSQGTQQGDAVELGCGVGGLHALLKPYLRSYLGVDSSFAGIALARHLALGVSYPGKIRIPEDLLAGPVSRPVEIPIPRSFDGRTDFVVGDLESLPVEKGGWDLTIALNAIDMMEDPSLLPDLQKQLLREGGKAIQSCPYIWHEAVARGLRDRLPREVRDSAAAARWLYEKAGFRIEKEADHVPWLFFKHARQLEIYSVHIFMADQTT